jgi:hypothetical protein
MTGFDLLIGLALGSAMVALELTRSRIAGLKELCELTRSPLQARRYSIFRL